MDMRKGNLLTFKLKYRSDLISGIVLDNRNGWVLIHRCADYRIDGYSIIRTDLISGQFLGDKERLTSKIIKKKYGAEKKSVPIKLTSLEEMLMSIQQKYHLLQLDNKKGDSFDVVKYLGSEELVYMFRELTINAKWRYKLKLPAKEITVVSFGNDYLNSLLLIL